MKTLIIVIISIVTIFSSCTINRINVYGNGNIINTPCTVHSVNHCYNYEGVHIIVEGSHCDYLQFVQAEHDRNVLLNKGYKMRTDYDVIVFTHPHFY